MSSYIGYNLTGILNGTGTSTLKSYFNDRYPNTLKLRKEFAAQSGPLLVDGGDANPGTVGTAFDLLMKLTLNKQHHPLPLKAGGLLTDGHVQAVDDLVVMTRVAQLEAGADSDDMLFRCCWVLALITEVYRSQYVYETSELNASIRAGSYSMKTELAAVPGDAFRQLSELRALAKERLLPKLRQPLLLGPTFSASSLIGADGDLIAGSTILDMKVQLGAKNPKTGLRADELKKQAMQQIVAYALLDSFDQYELDTIGFYSARYGNLTVWPLEEALATLAGEPVDVAAERARVLGILRS
ncbi:hypothetical protein ASF62_11060 [Leifsonia sp. Leaf325]|nr:hypothetical protein [Leifsonia sp. Leaf325]KQQ94600.1 hypothetical protein ASF62_11060 [Leifsonia sp. Leaf325]